MKIRMMTAAGALLAGTLVTMPVPLEASDLVYGPYGPGYGRNAWFNEWDRLSRHAYDYYYRNTNDNVYRNSRHFSPTQNVFRSSRYYQQKLIAASETRPIRSFTQITERVGDGEPVVRTFSWAYHHPYPFGHYGFRPPWTGDGPGPAYSVNRNTVRVADIRWERPAATDAPIVQKYTLPSGKTVTTVVSLPRDLDIDDAWQLLADGAHRTAATIFAQFTDGSRAAEAHLGHGLALARSGDTRAAALALDEAMIAGAQIAGDPSAWSPLHGILEEILSELNGEDAPVATIRDVVSAMLGRTDVAREKKVPGTVSRPSQMSSADRAGIQPALPSASSIKSQSSRRSISVNSTPSVSGSASWGS